MCIAGWGVSLQTMWQVEHVFGCYVSRTKNLGADFHLTSSPSRRKKERLKVIREKVRNYHWRVQLLQKQQHKQPNMWTSERGIPGMCYMLNPCTIWPKPLYCRTQGLLINATHVGYTLFEPCVSQVVLHWCQWAEHHGDLRPCRRSLLWTLLQCPLSQAARLKEWQKIAWMDPSCPCWNDRGAQGSQLKATDSARTGGKKRPPAHQKPPTRPVSALEELLLRILWWWLAILAENTGIAPGSWCWAWNGRWPLNAERAAGTECTLI